VLRPFRGVSQFAVLGLSLLVTAATGCSSRPARIRAIAVDPHELSEQFIEQYDTDGNGSLSELELQAFPPIHGARNKYDSDGNGEVSGEELAERFAVIFDPQVGLLPASCRVTHNGRPLSGAEVRFVPPKALDGVLPPATGVSDSAGVAWLRLAPEDLPASFPNSQAAVMRPGIYLVEVTHPDPQIPAQFNAKTTLGKEVFPEVMNGPPLPVALKF
jgi:hypothetical protein